MSAICEDCAPVVFDRYGDGREVRNDGVALCPLHAAAGDLVTWLEAHIEAFGECMCAHTPGTTCCDCRAREAVRAAKRRTLMSGAKQCDRCGEFIEWGQDYFEVARREGSSGTLEKELCESCGNILLEWLNERPAPTPPRRP